MTETPMHEHQTLLRFRAEDGFLITALLVTKEYEKKEDILSIPVLLQIHGLLGHFLARGTPRLLPHALLEHGFHSMSINTRLAFAGQMTSRGIVDDTIKDIDAAVEFLTREGFRNIFILGYSLGAAMVVHWAANREHPSVRSLVLEGGHYSFPDALRKRSAQWGSMPTYEEVYEKAQAVLGDDPYNSTNDETFVVHQASGPSREPIHSEIFTYKTWWFMAGPEAHNVMAYKHIGKINSPILMIRGENDPLVEGWDPEALAQIAREAGNTRVRVKQIPNAGHDCMENPDEMLKEIVNLMSTYST
ncbi:MAG: alpha/beta hydrolase family protein [Nitrospiraceae bacterium]